MQHGNYDHYGSGSTKEEHHMTDADLFAYAQADTGAQGADMTSKNSPVEGNDVGNAPQEEQDLSVFVQNLLTQMSSRFQQMSEAIVTRIDEMGDRIDGLEKSISELMAQAGVDEPGEAANTSSGGGAGDLLDDGNNAPTDD